MSLVTKTAYKVEMPVTEKTVLEYIKANGRCTSAQIIAETGVSKHSVHKALKKLRHQEISVVEYIKSKKTVAAVYVVGIHDEPDDPRESWHRAKDEKPEEPFIWQPHIRPSKWLSCVAQLEAQSKTHSKAANRPSVQFS